MANHNDLLSLFSLRTYVEIQMCLAWIPAVLRAYVSLCSSCGTAEPSQNNTKPWKPSLILIKYFHLSGLHAILTVVPTWLGSCLLMHTYDTI